MLETLRSLLLMSALGNLILSTVLYRVAGRPFIDWYLRIFQFPVQIQRFLANDRVVRGVGNRHVGGLSYRLVVARDTRGSIGLWSSRSTTSAVA